MVPTKTKPVSSSKGRGVRNVITDSLNDTDRALLRAYFLHTGSWLTTSRDNQRAQRKVFKQEEGPEEAHEHQFLDKPLPNKKC
eukprot:6365857-Amphidinium_carterae.1